MTVDGKRAWVNNRIRQGAALVLGLALGGALGSHLAWGAEPVTLRTLTFNPAARQLLLLTDPASQLTVDKTRFSRSGQVIQFELPGVKLLPATTSTVMITDSQTLQKVVLSVASRGGVPGVRVEVRVTPEGAFQPFSMVPEPRGLKLSWQSADSPPASPDAVVQTVDLTAPVLQPAISPKSKHMAAAASPPQMLGNPPENSLQAHSYPLKPKPSQAQEIPNRPSAVLSNGLMNSILGPVSPQQTSLIDDVFTDGRHVTVAGQGLPLTVKKSFALMAPSRFIVDISPAVMASTRPLRHVLADESGIELIKTSQFDESTVRCVIQFSSTTPPPVDVKSDSLKNRLLLSF